MNRWGYIVIAVFVMTALLQGALYASGGSGNLIKNASLEELNDSGELLHWERHRDGYEVSPEYHRTGQRGMLLSGTTLSYKGIRQHISDIPAGQKLVYAAWVYVESFDAGLIMPVHISYVDANGKQHFKNTKFAPGKIKENQWVKVTLNIDLTDSPEVTEILVWSLARVSLDGTQAFRGKVYIDDLSLTVQGQKSTAEDNKSLGGQSMQNRDTSNQNIAVDRQVYLTVEEAGGSPFTVNTCYVDATGGRLLQTISTIVSTDTLGRAYLRRSEDHGKTWSKLETLYKPVPSDEGIWRRGESALLADYANGIVLDLFNYSLHPGGNHSGDVQTLSRLCYRLSKDRGKTFGEVKRVIQKGYDDVNWAEKVTHGDNSLGISFAHPFIDSRGRAIVPILRFPQNLNDDSNRNIYLLSYETGCLIGTWTGSDYEWAMGPLLGISPEISTRGLCEPAMIELEDGRFVMLMRGSNYTKEHLPSYRWLSVSHDAGHSWAEATPLAYDDGEPCFSPAAGSSIFKSIVNGKIYWVGNLLPTNANGSRPRYPLVIAEFDPVKMALRRASVTVIDTRREGDLEQLQLSNFRVHQNRETGKVEVYLIRAEANGVGNWSSPSYQYTITLPST